MILICFICAYIWPAFNQEVELNISTSCSESIKSIYATKLDRILKNIYLVPEISCLVCSQPLCSNNDQSCKDKSTLKEFPLYNNILEFGFIKQFIPKETVATVKIKKSCSFKLIISSTTNPEKFLINFFECPQNECSETFDQNEIYFSEDNKCIHIGLIFRDPKKIYFSFSSNCYYVPTVYFEEPNTLGIKSPKCRFNFKTDKPSVSFQFLKGNSYPLDAIPVALPCTPGGYVVNSATGKFYHGTNCVKYFIDSQFTAEDTGLQLVISKVYEGNEDLVFPVVTYEEYGMTTYPAYMFENGSISSRERMKPKIRKNTFFVDKTRIACTYKEVSERFHQCKEEYYAWNHESSWVNDSYYHKYVPRYSCFLCAKPLCDYNSHLCDKWASTEILPVYNNLIEFGLYGLNFPIASDIRIALNDQCYLKVQIIPQIDLEHLSIFIYECLFDEKNCIISNYSLHGNFSFRRECLFLGLGFHGNKNIYFGFSMTCVYVPSSKFCDLSYLTLIQESCYFDTSRQELLVEYKFKQNDDRHTDGVAIILPCSPGGYAVSPFTGRFLVDEDCENLYWKFIPNKKSGIQFIIETWYNNNENLLFPIMKRVNATHRRLLPIFVKENHEGKSLEEMSPKNVTRKNQKSRYRIECYYNDSKYRPSRNGSLLPSPFDDVGVHESEGGFDYYDGSFDNIDEFRKKASQSDKSTGSSLQILLDVAKQRFITPIILTFFILILTSHTLR